MADSPQLLGYYNDFRGGDWARYGTGDAPPRTAPRNAFTGRNVFVYADGSISARPPVTEMDIDGTSTGEAALIQFCPANGRWYHAGSRPHSFLHVVGDTEVDASSAFAVAATAQRCDALFDNTTWYITIATDKVYTYDGNTTLAALGGTPPAGNAIAIFGERLVIGGDSTGKYGTASGRRVGYSAPSNFASWPATNFFDVGRPGDSIRSLEVMRDTLVVQMQGGDIHIVTGTLGSSEAQRPFTSPSFVRQRANYDRALRFAQTKRGTIWRHEPDVRHWPELFTGGDLDGALNLSNLFAEQVSVAFGTVVPGVDLDDVFVYVGRSLTSNRHYGWLLHNGCWTRHTFHFDDTTTITQSALGALGAHPTGVMWQRDNFDLGFKQFGFWDLAIDLEATSAASEFGFSDDWNTEDDAPAIIDSQFYTAPIYDEKGRSMQVRHVEVAFNAWDSAGTQPQFTIRPVALDVHESAGVSPTAITWTEAITGDDSTEIVRGFSFDCVPGRGFNVRVDDLRGVRIRAIRVYGDVTPARFA